MLCTVLYHPNQILLSTGELMACPKASAKFYCMSAAQEIKSLSSDLICVLCGFLGRVSRPHAYYIQIVHLVQN